MYKITFDINVTAEDIDDIMSVALEGGINYWCGGVEVEGHKLGSSLSEQISSYGKLKFIDLEDGTSYILDIHRFLNGLEKYVRSTDCAKDEIIQYDNEDNKYWIDTCQIDSCIADCIIQYALFGELVYS